MMFLTVSGLSIPYLSQSTDSAKMWSTTWPNVLDCPGHSLEISVFVLVLQGSTWQTVFDRTEVPRRVQKDRTTLKHHYAEMLIVVEDSFVL